MFIENTNNINSNTINAAPTESRKSINELTDSEIAVLAEAESKDRSLDPDDRNQFSDDWKVTRKELQANSYLLFCLHDYDNTVKKIPRSHIILSAWHQTKFPVDSQERQIVLDIQSHIGYTFANERLLIQALTRRSYGVEHMTHADYEVLEFTGDRVIEYVLTRLMLDQYSRFLMKDKDGMLFCCDLDEGNLSKMKSRFTNKEHLAERSIALGLDTRIRFGQADINTGMNKAIDPKEDVVEAVIGAVAIDCGWDYEILADVVDTMLALHLDFDAWEKDWDLFEKVNTWNQRHYGKMPEYQYAKDKDRHVECVLILGNNETFHDDGATRSKARSFAAKRAYDYLNDNGLWKDVKECGITPRLADAINQLQELYQKGYVEKPEYKIDKYDEGLWECNCRAGEFWDGLEGRYKMEAKKRAAFAVMLHVLKSGGVDVKDDEIELFKYECGYLKDMDEFGLKVKQGTVEMEEICSFIIGMANKYDIVFAEERCGKEARYGDGDRKGYMKAVGRYHEGIKKELCELFGMENGVVDAWRMKWLKVDRRVK